MFCSECGREIVENAKICSYCGKPVQGNNQPYRNVQPNPGQQYYSNQADNNPQYYSNPTNNYSANYMQQPYGSQFNNDNSRNLTFKPDNRFNLVAGLFTWIWALCKGMWDLFLLDFLISFICGILIPLGIVIIPMGIVKLARIIIVGRNANYYYRLKELEKIPMYKAIQDPNLRRI